MKKFFAVFLAMAMLCSFAAMGAAATEDGGDLQARGEALLHETYASISGGQYTLKGLWSHTDYLEDALPESVAIAVDGELFAMETVLNWEAFVLSSGDFGTDRFPVLGKLLPALFRLVLGTKNRLISSSAGLRVLFPDRRFALKLSDPGTLFLAREFFPLLPEALTVTEQTLGEDVCLCVSFWGPGGRFQFSYLDGQLKYIDTPDGQLAVTSLVPVAEPSYFSMKGIVLTLPLDALL